MAFELGRKIKLEVTGASHAEKITVRLSGIPQGVAVDMARVQAVLDRRAGGKGAYTTPRKEADTPVNITGIENGITTGEPIYAEFINANKKSADYSNLTLVPRPSHADFAAYSKYGYDFDMSGGSFFSGRMTLPMCFAGAIASEILEKKGIKIGAHMLSVGDVYDDYYDSLNDDIPDYSDGNLPVISKTASNKMEALMTQVAKDGDSIGGVIECKVTGLKPGVGNPIYESIESVISYGMFGIPAVKGIEFGKGFDISKMRGSEANDPFAVRDGKVTTLSNNSGGIQGGLSNGMPLIFRVAIKPTPSISKEQKSVDLKTMTDTTITIKGRHDSCIVVRAVPCVEAMCALMLYDIISE